MLKKGDTAKDGILMAPMACFSTGVRQGRGNAALGQSLAGPILCTTKAEAAGVQWDQEGVLGQMGWNFCEVMITAERQVLRKSGGKKSAGFCTVQ